MSEQFRQGDVLLERVPEIPSDAAAVDWSKEGRIVLVEGKATGHAHALSLGSAEMLQSPSNEDRWLKVVSPDAVVVHEEHGPIPLPVGEYAIVRQREYTPTEIRNVLD